MNIPLITSISFIFSIIALIVFFVYRSSDLFKYSYKHCNKRNKTIMRYPELKSKLTEKEKADSILGFEFVLEQVFRTYGSNCKVCSFNVTNSWFLSQDQLDYAQNYFKCFFSEYWDFDDFKRTFEINDSASKFLNKKTEKILAIN